MCSQHLTAPALPAELFPQYCTMEYRLPINKPIFAPAYIFVVDTCLTEGERCCQKGLQSPQPQLCHARRRHFVQSMANLLVTPSFSLTTVPSAAPAPCTAGKA